MRFTIDAQTFRKTLSRVSSILSARSKDFCGFNIGAEDGRISVACSNGAEAMREYVQTETPVDGDGGFVFVPSDHLIAIVNKERGLLDIAIGERSIQIKSNDAEYALGVGAPKLGFKDWPAASFDRGLIVDSRLLGRALSLAGVTESFEVYQQYAMDKLALDYVDGKLRIYTTDPRRMVVAWCDVLGGSWEHSHVLLPDQSCAYAMSIFPEKEKASAQVRIVVDGSSVIFASENRTFIGRQVIGRVPDPKKFLRESSEHEFHYRAGELLLAFQRVCVITSEAERQACKIVLDGERLVITGEAGQVGGKVRVELMAEANGLPGAQHMSPKYAADFLRRLYADEDVALGFNAKSALVELRCKGAVCMIAKMTER